MASIRPEDDLVRLLATHALAGGLAGLVFVVGLLGLDLGGIGSMALRDGSLAAPALLVLGFVVTFASAAMGVAIMRVGKSGDDDHDDDGEYRRLVPVPVRAGRGRQG